MNAGDLLLNNGKHRTDERGTAMKRIKHFFRVQIVCAILLMVLTGIIPAAGADASFSQDPAAIEQAADSVFILEVYSSRRQKIAVGSGFVAFDASLLVTNYHVIEGGAYVIAISDDQDQYLLNRICCSSKTKDIAILQFDEASRAKPLPLNADTSRCARNRWWPSEVLRD